MYISLLAVAQIIYAAECGGDRIRVAVCVLLRHSGSWGLHPGDQVF